MEESNFENAITTAKLGIVQSLSDTKNTTGPIKNADGLIKRFTEDNDPQTIFFVNFPSVFSGLEVCETLKCNLVNATEHNVESRLGKKKEGDGIQLNWNRASYRSKVLAHALETTTCLSPTVAKDPATEKQDLTGDQSHDREIYKKVIHGYFKEFFPEPPTERLEVIEKYIAETLTLSQGKVNGIQHFTVILSAEGHGNQPVLRAVTLAFERKDDNGTKKVTVTRRFWEWLFDKSVFDQQEFDQEHQKSLELVKPLLRKWTLDTAA